MAERKATSQASLWLRARAWTVHLYTAAGAVLGLLALDMLRRGNFRETILLMFAAMAVDATDGVLARRFRVAQILPQFDGRRLDDVVDYLNYVVVPVALMRATGLLPGSAGFATAGIALIASAYGFCRVDAKTADDFFTGFPSYWNVVAFYLYAGRFTPPSAILVVLGFAVLVFVPLRYVYPSRTPSWRMTTIPLGTAWFFTVLYLILRLPRTPPALLALSGLFPAYYFGLSGYLSWRAMRIGRQD